MRKNHQNLLVCANRVLLQNVADYELTIEDQKQGYTLPALKTMRFGGAMKHSETVQTNCWKYPF